MGKNTKTPTARPAYYCYRTVHGKLKGESENWGNEKRKGWLVNIEMMWFQNGTCAVLKPHQKTF
jgi:hypothetical protein